MKNFVCLFEITFLLGLQLVAQCQSDPFSGPDQFPQFRNISALSGGGYGVDVRGYPSLRGPVAYSTPIGYVLGHGHFEALGAIASFTAGPDFGHHNAKGAMEYGHSFGPVNVMVSDLIKSSRWDHSDNVQLGWSPRNQSRLGVSLGIQDVSGGGGSAGEGFPVEDSLTSRSFFGVATYEAVQGENPIYFTLGGGTRRFNGFFGSISGRIAKPVRIWVEHDTFGFNEGVLLAVRSGTGKRTTDVNVSIGWLKSRYFALSAGLGF